MSEEQLGTEDLKKELCLKFPESEIQDQQPWADDVLERSKIGEALTNLLGERTDSLVINVNGYWGTGKTFFLKRWQKQLEQKGFKAIYFNAWEDDFCDNPLVAILGQLSESLKGNEFQECMAKIGDAAKVLFIHNLKSVTNKFTGLTFPDETLEQLTDKTLEEYSRQRDKKDELKARLKELSSKIKEETKHPLVFVIDELDRCRPTFAIELLERVKHIFDIPGMVFVLGINRDELCSSIRSVYGDIDADVYLRRFFDMEFLLPEAKSETFCRHLIGKYKLNEFFSKLSNSAEHQVHQSDFAGFENFFPLFCGRLELSLRDIDNCIKTMAFVGKQINLRHFMYPRLLSVLIILRLKDHARYQGFVKGNLRGSKVMDYVDGLVSGKELDSNLNYQLDMIEVDLYLTQEEEKTVSQLKLLTKGEPLTQPEYLSERTRNSDKNRANEIFQEMQRRIGRRNFYREDVVVRDTIKYLSGLIELVEIPQQRHQ